MQVALKDLEIRGAGNLLGGEQSGHIAGVGFDLYLRMIGEAVNAFRGEVAEGQTELRLELPVDARIPRTTWGASGCGSRRTRSCRPRPLRPRGTTRSTSSRRNSSTATATSRTPCRTSSPSPACAAPLRRRGSRMSWSSAATCGSRRPTCRTRSNCGCSGCIRRAHLRRGAGRRPPAAHGIRRRTHRVGRGSPRGALPPEVGARPRRPLETAILPEVGASRVRETPTSGKQPGSSVGEHRDDVAGGVGEPGDVGPCPADRPRKTPRSSCGSPSYRSNSVRFARARRGSTPGRRRAG